MIYDLLVRQLMAIITKAFLKANDKEVYTLALRGVYS